MNAGHLSNMEQPDVFRAVPMILPPGAPATGGSGDRVEAEVVPKLCPTPAHSSAFQRTPAHDAVVILAFNIKHLRTLTRAEV